MYIVTQLMSKKDKQKLQETFKALDLNADGKLSRDELIQGYKLKYQDEELAVKEVDTIMKNIDVDHNGFIDYSGIIRCSKIWIEFLIASVNKEKILSKDNLKKAFGLFDKVKSGGIGNRTKVDQFLLMKWN